MSTSPVRPHPLIQALRANRAGDDRARDAVRERLYENPGRAAGRVADWAVERTCAHLALNSRRPLRVGQIDDIAMAADERHILDILDTLRGGDTALASRKAEWLVTRDAVSMLLERMHPMVTTLPTHEPRAQAGGVDGAMRPRDARATTG
jgi:hypothetical protein